MSSETIGSKVLPVLGAIVLLAGLVAIALSNVMGRGLPQRYGFLFLSVAVLLFWLYTKIKARENHGQTLLVALLTVAAISFAAALNWSILIILS
jgi:drug/metabolite transporter (DMT)-like permease